MAPLVGLASLSLNQIRHNSRGLPIHKTCHHWELYVNIKRNHLGACANDKLRDDTIIRPQTRDSSLSEKRETDDAEPDTRVGSLTRRGRCRVARASISPARKPVGCPGLFHEKNNSTRCLFLQKSPQNNPLPAYKSRPGPSPPHFAKTASSHEMIDGGDRASPEPVSNPSR